MPSWLRSRPPALRSLAGRAFQPARLPQTTVIGPRQQPYFKLHGSMNWQANNGGRLLVMGGNKPTTMQSHQILMWYANKFYRKRYRDQTLA